MLALLPAARDGKHTGPLDLDRYGTWLKQDVQLGSALLALWEKQELIRRAAPPARLAPSRLQQIDPAAAEKVSAYLALDEAGDTSWSDIHPVSEMGGEVIYILEHPRGATT